MGRNTRGSSTAVIIAVYCDHGHTDVPASTLPEITADTN